jgi:hypothetical protein
VSECVGVRLNVLFVCLTNVRTITPMDDYEGDDGPTDYTPVLLVSLH